MPTTMKSAALMAGAFALRSAAYPFALENVGEIGQRQSVQAGSAAAQKISAARSNCGVVPCTTFSETEQFVSTSGEHAFVSPGADEIRGPCPGLNAAANHGYLSHSGVTTLPETVEGLAEAFGMSTDLSAFLAAYAILVDGDPVLGTWSIGGPPPTTLLTKTLLGSAQGISYSHNNYEGDVSIARGDAYINNGDAHSLQMPRFLSAFEANSSPNRYTLDVFAQNYGVKLQQSINDNPYYFSAPFAGLVAPAAYNFVINFMSNHTAEEPSGYFDGEQFKTFFGVSGDYPNFTWNRGQEKIPENWYRRPSDNPYSIAGVFADLGAQFLAYPTQVRFGGNTGTTNSYVGVDLGDLTGGVINADNLMQGNNLQCFFGQFAQAGIPDVASKPIQDLSSLLAPLDAITSSLDCPAVADFDQTLFNKYPGYTYDPTGAGVNY